jgi:hypothetical protein
VWCKHASWFLIVCSSSGLLLIRAVRLDVFFGGGILYNIFNQIGDHHIISNVCVYVLKL